MEKLNVPTEVLCGRNVIVENANKLKEIGTHAFIVSGKKSVFSNGSLDDVLKALNSLDIKYTLFNEVMANPTIPLVYDGSKKLKENGCELHYSYRWWFTYGCCKSHSYSCKTRY